MSRDFSFLVVFDDLDLSLMDFEDLRAFSSFSLLIGASREIFSLEDFFDAFFNFRSTSVSFSLFSSFSLVRLLFFFSLSSLLFSFFSFSDFSFVLVSFLSDLVFSVFSFFSLLLLPSLLLLETFKSPSFLSFFGSFFASFFVSFFLSGLSFRSFFSVFSLTSFFFLSFFFSCFEVSPSFFFFLSRLSFSFSFSVIVQNNKIKRNSV